jgi:hypothetical protein
MAVWLIRAGSHGEYEQKFIQEGRVYVTWDDLDVDLAKLEQRSQLVEAMTQRYPNAKPKTIMNWVSQVWPFGHEIKKSDLAILPLKEPACNPDRRNHGRLSFRARWAKSVLSLAGRQMDWGGDPSRQFRKRPAEHLRRFHDHLPCPAQQR